MPTLKGSICFGKQPRRSYTFKNPRNGARSGEIGKIPDKNRWISLLVCGENPKDDVEWLDEFIKNY